MQKTALTLILPFILSLANVNESPDQFKNNIGINFLPLAVSEDSYPMGNPNDFNEGYKRDLRLGITVGFAF